MEKPKVTDPTVQNIIDLLNCEFNWKHPLKPADIEKPHVVMEALFQILDRLGVNTSLITAKPNDEAEVNYQYLLPVINMTRVVNHFVSVMPHVTQRFNITNFLQPTCRTSQCILVLMFNLMAFHKETLEDITPYEQDLFAKIDQVKALEEEKKKMQQLLNDQTEEIMTRGERLEKIETEIKQYEEELKQEQEIHDKEKPELDTLMKEIHQANLLIEQKKNHLEALLAEVARKKDLRVYDAEDIKAQAEQAAQSVQEAEEKMMSLKTTLQEKENSIKNLQTIKPNLDTANNLLHDIMKLTEDIKEQECGDLESESKEGELEMLSIECGELRAQLAELQAARAQRAASAARARAASHAERAAALSALREAEENDMVCRERCKKASQRIEQLKNSTVKYEQDRAVGFEQIQAIREEFQNKLMALEEMLLKKACEVEKNITEKFRNCQI